MGLREDYEFKFSRSWSHPERREAFFQAAIQHQFRFAAASIDKRHEDRREASSDAYHRATTTYLASSLRQTYLEARRALVTAGHGKRLDELVVVDDNGDKRFLAMVNETFRGLESACVPPVFLIGKVRFRGSGRDEQIQLVDRE